MKPDVLFRALQELRLLQRAGHEAGVVLYVPDQAWSDAAMAQEGGNLSIQIDRGLRQPRFVRDAGAYDGKRFADLVQAALLASIGADIWADLDALLAQPEPTSRYGIVCTARSGSTWLCTQLQRVAGTGLPKEHLRPPVQYLWENADALGFDRDAWLSGLERHASVDGTFGTKIIEEFARPLGSAISPAEKTSLIAKARAYNWLHLERRDKVAQAVSRFIAEASDQWHLRAGDDQEKYQRKKNAIAYDGAKIAYHLENLETGDRAIRRLFAQLEINPLGVIYEDILADPDPAIVQIADYLVPDHGALAAAESTRKSVLPISDDINHRFIDKFKAGDMI